MGKAALIVMAAGMGSRYGGGIKQLAQVGPSGEMIIDYSVHDAIEAGFDKVVFVIRKDIEEEFRQRISGRIEKRVETAYVYQELADIPEGFGDKLEGRVKPWGTGQAVLCCKDVVKEPFLVINADDYYGKEAYREAYRFLTGSDKEEGVMKGCMVGFVLENTLSANGTVTRGVCKIDDSRMLTDIEETYDIKSDGDTAVAVRGNEEIRIPLKTPVSMNMWGLHPDFFDILEKRFAQFLEKLEADDKKKEYLLPQIIRKLIQDKEIEIKVLQSKDRWFGVTYKEDKEAVVDSIRELIRQGIYPDSLY